MIWKDVRCAFPEQWLLVEAVKAYSGNHQRFIEDMVVLDAFTDSREAFKQYKHLHHLNRGKEYYVVHTSHEVLQIPEVPWLGLRGVT